MSKYLDPVTNRNIYYDRSAAAWLYEDDNSPYQASSSVPRTANDDSGSAELQRQQWDPDTYGSSPNHTQYTTGGPSVDELSRQLSAANLDEETSSHDARDDDGDETPKQIYFGTVERTPVAEITDPTLFNQGYRFHGRIRGTPGNKEHLDKDFRKQREPKKFFRPGKVFKILWPEHQGYSTAGMTVITDGKFVTEEIVTKIRWFIVVKAGKDFCSCLPIATYGRRACTKPAVVKWQHSIVYSGRDEPQAYAGEEPDEGERGMLPAIRVNPKNKQEKLDPTSRINYGKTYTVEHYVKVRDFGDVHEKYVSRLRKQWMYVMKRDLAGHLDDQDDQEEEGDDHAGNEETPIIEWVTAKYAYGDPKMMKMEAGDRIGVRVKVTGDWWKGVNLRTDEVNLFPSAYVDRDE